MVTNQIILIDWVWCGYLFLDCYKDVHDPYQKNLKIDFMHVFIWGTRKIVVMVFLCNKLIILSTVLIAMQFKSIVMNYFFFIALWKHY